MYRWENDPSVWRVSGTTAPFSRHALERFVEEQRFDIFQTRQQRLIIETPDRFSDSRKYRNETNADNSVLNSPRIIGALDLFEFDPLNRRAGIGILIHPADARRQGYATDVIETGCRYAREVLGLHQLWCNVGATNTASLALFRNAGFVEVGTKRDWLWTPDGYTDEVLFQKLLEK
ncbi:MAG: GNAT family N-acetyltransferase [Alistipes senegalensis]|nr:GNAT family N-acetyltransferase [Bacteroides cellulosilyticus]MCM1352336.1 GNAT family N-acetyltransferase [Alistipes senegalensis]